MSKLLDKLKKNSTVKHSSILSQSDFFNSKDTTPTELPIINIATSGNLYGGFRSGILTIAGPSRHFKSVLGLFMVKAYLKKNPDAVCLYYDSEFGAPPEYLEAMGINTEQVLHTPVMHVEQLKFDLSAQLENIERGEKVIVFIDSIGNLASKKEVDDALDQKSVADMTRAKQIKSLFRIATPHFTSNDIPCIVINHTYESQGMFPTAVVSGGCLEAGTKIKTAEGDLVSVEDFKEGDVVVTKHGPKPVTHVWNPETLAEGYPECYRIEFEDGYSVVCSDEHKFLIDGDWVEASRLRVGDDVETI